LAKNWLCRVKNDTHEWRLEDWREYRDLHQMTTDVSVTLRDGRIVSSSSEAWRLECEARTILKRKDRKEYLEKVRQKRGVDAAVELRNEMLAIKDGR
jgi:hypothetical protein